MVMRERLDDHPGEIRLERPADMGGGALWVAHVVKASKESDEAISAGIGLGGRDLEARVGADAGFFGGFSGALDRSGVIIEADEARIGESTRHEHGRCAVTESDIRNLRAAFELLDWAASDITSLIWCTGFLGDFRWIQLRGVLDDAGQPIHEHVLGILPGLYLPASGTIPVIADEAARLADDLFKRRVA